MSSTAVFFPGMNPQKRKHQVREVSPMRVSEDFMLINPELFKHEDLEKLKQDKQETATRKRKSKSKSKGKTVKKRKPKKRRRKTRNGRK
jgi:hypothetical protein